MNRRITITIEYKNWRFLKSTEKDKEEINNKQKENNSKREKKMK